MTLPRDVRSWPEEAVEEWRERASIVYEGCGGETAADWAAAKEAAERMVRTRWLTRGTFVREPNGSHVHSSAPTRRAIY